MRKWDDDQRLKAYNTKIKNAKSSILPPMQNNSKKFTLSFSISLQTTKKKPHNSLQEALSSHQLVPTGPKQLRN